MITKFLKDLEDRRTFVEKNELDFDSKNKEHFRNFWLHMIVLTSAIAIGVLPLLNEESTLIKSPILAKIGLLFIIVVPILIIMFFQNTLSRERDLFFEQKFFHNDVFTKQYQLLMQAKAEGKSEDEIQKLFDESKSNSFIQEQNIVAKHILPKKFRKTRLFLDKNFNCIITLLFVVGIILVIISFIK